MNRRGAETLEKSIRESPDDDTLLYLKSTYGGKGRVKGYLKEMKEWDTRGGRLYDAIQSTEVSQSKTMAQQAQRLLVGSENVLDMQCGTGIVACWLGLNNPGKEIYGLDISRVMLTEAERKRNLLGLKNVHFVQANMRSMPFPDGFFGAAYQCRTHWPAPGRRDGKESRVLEAEEYRVIRSGGYFLKMKTVEGASHPDKWMVLNTPRRKHYSKILMAAVKTDGKSASKDYVLVNVTEKR